MSTADIGARDKLDQIVRACFIKAVEIVLHDRVLPFTPGLKTGNVNQTVRSPRDAPWRFGPSPHPLASHARQFNVALPEVEPIRRELSTWDPRVGTPLHLDVMVDLDARGAAAGGERTRYESGASPGLLSRLFLVERWSLRYTPSDQR